tara:strand:+ start:743 stop:1600 length:858 start_codon:yes stop_codon:yes gene_type:complete
MIPTVIIHEEYQEYLETNIQISGKNNEIFLIGNSSVKVLEKYPNITYVDISKYINSKKLQDYKKVFVNYSNYEIKYSFFTFIRMIIISEFMKDYGFEKVFSNDSDNLLLKNINEYNFKKDSALCIPTVWEPFYFATSVHSALISKSFCAEYERMYVDVFVNKSRLPLFEQKIEYHNSNPGSFCDMTFYHFLNDLNLVEAENLLKPKLINGEQHTFVNNYANGEGPESKNQYKVNRKGIKIYTNMKLQTNKIYDTINKNYLGIFNMHYQGNHKKYLNKSLLKKLVF